ncbi:MAG TPA: ROK family protein [Actinomycetota bacterium]|nr:ROK family protein [Actinomycetota bacterium]
MTEVFAIDLGGTRCKSAVVEVPGWRTHDEWNWEVRGERTGPMALKVALERAEKMISSHGCTSAALCVPGLVDERGVIVSLPGKLEGIVGLDLPAEFESATGLRAIVLNDAVAYGVGETVAGAAKGAGSAVVVTIGTGVGVCVVRDGRPVGRGMLAGGILGGQIPVSGSSFTDTSGRTGTIEADCLADRIVDQANLHGGTFATVVDVYRAAAEGDGVAVSGIDAYRRALARGLVALAHAHTPDVIVLGGGPMTRDNPVFTGLQELLDESLWPGYRAEVRSASLGDKAALIGLAHLVAG